MRPASGHLDVSTEELEALLERARQEPLEPDGYEKLKAAIRTLGYVTELLEIAKPRWRHYVGCCVNRVPRRLTKCSSEPASKSTRRIISPLANASARQRLRDTGVMVLPPITGHIESRFDTHDYLPETCARIASAAKYICNVILECWCASKAKRRLTRLYTSWNGCAVISAERYSWLRLRREWAIRSMMQQQPA